MILIAEGRNGDVDWWLGPVGPLLRLRELDRPARVAVLLAEFSRLVLPFVRDADFLNRLLLVVSVALFWRGDQAGVDDLAAHGDIAARPRPGVEQPDWPAVGNPGGQAQSEEAHERQPVVDQELRAFVRQIVGGLDDEDLEHHDRIKWRPAALRAIGIGQRIQEIAAKNFKIHGSTKRFELIAEVAQSP